MKIQIKKSILAMILTISVIVCTVSVSAMPVSPALDIIAGEYGLIKASLVSRDVYFTPQDFENAAGIEKVENITVESLPDSSLGTLMLGNIAINRNQSISRKNIENMRFVPSVPGKVEATFKFSLYGYNTGAYTCTIYLLEKENCAPTVSEADGSALKISTYENISFYGALKATDTENDPIKYEVVSHPEHGKLTLTNNLCGSYKYTPDSGYFGTDAFSFAAVDKYGNRSDNAQVLIEVKKPDSNIVFADMNEHWAHSQAICAVSSGIMNFKTENGVYTFSPDSPISRAEFCAALMRRAGYTGYTESAKTDFVDDADIPAEYKGLICIAQILGVANGYPTENGNCFYPNNQITRAEAAVMINRVFGFPEKGDIEVFADSDSVPAWAVSPMSALCSAGIMNGDANGNISAYDTLTRAHTAVLLSNIG